MFKDGGGSRSGRGSEKHVSPPDSRVDRRVKTEFAESNQVQFESSVRANERVRGVLRGSKALDPSHKTEDLRIHTNAPISPLPCPDLVSLWYRPMLRKALPASPHHSGVRLPLLRASRRSLPPQGKGVGLACETERQAIVLGCGRRLDASGAGTIHEVSEQF